MKKIYFLCTGNSCRSQMAEGYARKHLNGHYEVQSAGVEVHGLNPLAVEAMAEDGVDISNLRTSLSPSVAMHVTGVQQSRPRLRSFTGPYLTLRKLAVAEKRKWLFFARSVMKLNNG